MPVIYLLSAEARKHGSRKDYVHINTHRPVCAAARKPGVYAPPGTEIGSPLSGKRSNCSLSRTIDIPRLFDAERDAFRIKDPPFTMGGSAFRTVNRDPLTFTLNISSKRSALISSNGENFPSLARSVPFVTSPCIGMGFGAELFCCSIPLLLQY